MITTLLLWAVSFLLDLASGASNLIAKGFSIWPPTLLQGITYFFVHLMNFDFLLNIYQMLLSIKWLISFLVVYVLIKLFLRLLNFMRGSGELDV